MTTDEIKAAIEAERASLHDDFLKYAERVGLEITTVRFARAWRAWEWCRRQLKARGLTDEAAKEEMHVASNSCGRPTDGDALYAAIRVCLFG